QPLRRRSPQRRKQAAICRTHVPLRGSCQNCKHFRTKLFRLIAELPLGEKQKPHGEISGAIAANCPMSRSWRALNENGCAFWRDQTNAPDVGRGSARHDTARATQSCHGQTERVTPPSTRMFWPVM